MKIVFIGGRDTNALGGIEAYTKNLSQEMVRRGHDCVVWCESDHRSCITLNGVKIYYHKGPKSPLFCKPWCGLKATLKTLLFESNVDVIHYNAWPPSLCSWIPRLFGKRSIMEGHGLEWKRSKYSPTEQKVMKLMERITALTNTNLVMCSQSQVRYFSEEYNVKSVCIPGAVNMPDLSKNNHSLVLVNHKIKAGFYFLFLGRLVKEKNPDCLIKAFLKSGLTDMQLVIAGNCDSKDKFVNHLFDLAGDDERIIFTGPVFGEDKDMLLRNAYCFCLPSTIEGLSIALMEASSYKLPIIASNIEANTEFLGESALFVKPENVNDLVQALKQSVSSKDLMETQAESNYQNVIDHYTWQEVAEQYEKFLKTIINK